MTDLQGVKVCGRRGGKPFVDVQRPTSDGNCPSNTVPCSRATSPENTICIEANEFESGIPVDCPITDVKLIGSRQADFLDPTFYRILDFKQYKLVYSKNADSLPI